MLNWITTQRGNHISHIASTTELSAHELRQTAEACIEKAVSLLPQNIQNDSLYLLFEWHPTDAALKICITDASKTRDAPETVYCAFPVLLQQPDDVPNQIESVKFWLHDYLTTCTAFLSYSLVAIFHSSSRAYTELL